MTRTRGLSNDTNDFDQKLEQLLETAKEITGVSKDGVYTMVRGLLFFSDRQSGRNLRLCIPEALIGDILHQCHDATGHPGIRRLYLSLSSRVYFPRMSRRIRAYINNCVTCQVSKPSHEKPAGLLHPITTPELHHTVTLDFITGLPKSHGKDAVLTVTEKYSKAIRIIPCNITTSAAEAARLYLEYCYPIFGLPSRIISDRDARFTSLFWSTLTRLLNIRLGLTAAYHPSADGQSEKTNQTVEIALRCFIGGDTSKYHRWVEYLPILEHEYNSTINVSTGFSPNEVRYIVPPRGIMDITTVPAEPINKVSDAAQQLVEDLQNRRDEARDSIALAQARQKKYADANRSEKEYTVGDLVLIRYSRLHGYKPPKGHRHKLGPLSTPVRITEKLSPLSYRVALPPGSQIHDVLSIVHLKRFHGDGSDIRPLPILVEGEEGSREWEFEVESIDGVRKNEGNVEYLVRWKGYGIDDRTWEPIEHLDHAQEALDTWRSLQETQVPSVRRNARLQHRQPQPQQDSDDIAPAIPSDDEVSRIANASNVTVKNANKRPAAAPTTDNLSRSAIGDRSVGIRRSARIANM